MKKITDFLVDKRNFILIFVTVLTIISVILMLKVNIITDMQEYLPNDSSMKQGVDLLGDEFTNMPTSNTIRVMFDDLSEQEIEDIKVKLSQIEYVDSVDYVAEDEHYNKDNHTLFVLNITYDFDTDEMDSIEDAVSSDFKDYDMVYCLDKDSGEGLPLWIMGAALVIMMVILFLMCNSWIEPFLFLIAIGMAIVINMGTNAFLSGVSNITYSIASILQLALSMDYSIILMNRYRQELKITENRPQAMKSAIRGAFSSITSSSVTTIVGLLVLCFMSFKIGADMGIVLAKGVFISLVSVFTVLPALIIIFDKLIHKTNKKVLNFSMRRIGNFSYKVRYVVLGVFIVFFIALMATKGTTKISYSMKNISEINDIFPKSNTIVMLYNNEDEEAVASLIPDLEKEDGVESVTAYGNTLGKKYLSQEMAVVINGMSEMQIDASVLNLIYYDYFKDGEIATLKLSDFIGFLQKDVMTNEAFASSFDENSKTQIQMLALFSSKEELTKARSSAELSGLFGIDNTLINQLYAMSGADAMSIQELLQVISSNQDILASISKDEANAMQMQLIQTIVGAVMQDKEFSAAEMTQLFGGISEALNEQTMQVLYTLYFSSYNTDSTWQMSIYELFSHLISSMVNDEKYAMFFSDDMKAELEGSQSQLENGLKQLKGENYSLLMISTSLPEESDETDDFISNFEEDCEKLENDYYLIGNSPMIHEMLSYFDDELNKITILTALSIFIVVMLTFRSLIIPAILVLIIQAAVYATTVIMGIQGMSIHYLAYLIVQSILMGATIDYGILYTTYYREKRSEMGINEAIIQAYNGSIHTILTSGLIMVVVTAILGYAFKDPTVGQICHTISKGAATAIILILFILPGILASFDRWIVKRKDVLEEKEAADE